MKIKKPLLDQAGNVLKHKLSEILTGLMQQENLNDVELCKHTGLPIATLRKLRLSHSNNPTVETLLPLARYFGITIDQLLGLKKIEGLNIEVSTGINTKVIPIIEIAEAEAWLTDRLKLKDSEYTYLNVSIPFAGKGFALMVKGSMVSSAFPEGSILIFDGVTQVKDGDYGLILFDPLETSVSKPLPMIKKILFDGGSAFFKPFNPELGGIICSSTYKILAVMKQIQINLF